MLRKAFRLSAQERRVVAEALFLTPVAALAIRILGLESAARLLAFRSGGASRSNISAERIAALVEAAASRTGGRCLDKALVLHGVLARRGVESTVVIGAETIDSRFRAHAWVQAEARTLMGAGSLSYTPIWRFSALGTLGTLRTP